ncbi:MAG TPA: energy transducer TonB, partial [Chromatiales bacterium]|nr:energy transducer TonB [Chromatiales bacterium]
RGMEGRVLLRVEVGSDGRVTAIRVQESSGFRLLDDAALTTVRAWRFAPARREGKAIPGKVLVPIRFRLQSGDVALE